MLLVPLDHQADNWEAGGMPALPPQRYWSLSPTAATGRNAWEGGRAGLQGPAPEPGNQPQAMTLIAVGDEGCRAGLWLQMRSWHVRHLYAHRPMMAKAIRDIFTLQKSRRPEPGRRPVCTGPSNGRSSGRCTGRSPYRRVARRPRRIDIFRLADFASRWSRRAGACPCRAGAA